MATRLNPEMLRRQLQAVHGSDIECWQCADQGTNCGAGIVGNYPYRVPCRANCAASKRFISRQLATIGARCRNCNANTGACECAAKLARLGDPTISDLERWNINNSLNNSARDSGILYCLLPHN